MTRLLTTFAALTALGTASAQVPEAWKDWPFEVFDRVGVERVELRGILGFELRGILGFDLVGVEPVDLRGVLGTGAAVSPVEMPPAVSARDQLMLACLKVGEVSPSVRGWLRELNREALLKVVEAVPRTRLDHAASDAAVEALVEVHAVGEKDEGALSDKVLLRLAEYYAASGNERCVPLYERLLAKRKELADGWVPELFGLAWFSFERGDPAAAAEVFGRAAKHSCDPTFLRDCRLEAGRVLGTMGDWRRAAQLLREARASGEKDWISFVSLLWEAHHLAENGRLAEAEVLLRPPVTGEYGGRAAFVAASKLGELLYRGTKLDGAEEMLRKAVELEPGLELKDYDIVHSLPETNRKLLSEIEGFRRRPVRARTAAVQLAPGNATLEQAHVKLECCRKDELVATCSLPFVRTEVLRQPASGLNGQFPYGAEVKLSVAGAPAAPAARGVLRIAHRGQTEPPFELPVRIVARAAPIAFLGFTVPGSTVTRRLALPSLLRTAPPEGAAAPPDPASPFRVTRVESVGGEAPDGFTLLVQVRLSPDCPKGRVSGELALVLPDGGAVRVPCQAHAVEAGSPLTVAE